jgi:effector-binding domain-containing protein
MTATEYKPTIRHVQPINFLFFRTVTTVNELAGFFDIAPKLYAEAAKSGLHITGPIHWHYFGFTDLQKPFTLEIALPVSEIIPEYDGSFHFKRTENFACISLVHEGNWLEIPRSYEKLIAFAMENRLTPSGNNREVYVNVDFVNPEANVAEIQLGIL